MKRILILLLFFIIKTKLCAQFVPIPDPKFRQFLQNMLPGVMSGNQMDTTHVLVTTTDSLNVSAWGIKDLTGLQYFSSLWYLNCSYDSITYFPTFPAPLTYLRCEGCVLTSLPSLPASLTYLNCSYNALTNLNSLPPSLTYLNCIANNLSSLPALPSGLISLLCGTNLHLKQLPQLPNNLELLICGQDSLLSLPLVPTSLKILVCGNNHITSLPTLPNTMVDLQCAQNQLSTLPPLPDSLRFFVCAYNNLTQLNSLPSKLSFLSCGDNSIACFPIFPDSITSFYIDPNPYNCFPNYINAMNTTQLNIPLCGPGNSNNCAIASITEIDIIVFDIYPLPTSDLLNIRTPLSGYFNITLYDQLFRPILMGTFTQQKQFDITHLISGVYFLEIKNQQGDLGMKKIIIEK